jgi:hypothetical protein
MNCSRWKREFQKWAERAFLNENEAVNLPEELSEHASECNECSKRLDSFLLLKRGTPLKRYPDEQLSKRVYDYIERKGSIKKQKTLWWIALPAAACLLVVLSVFLTLTFVSTSKQMVTINLSLEAPHATSVSVVGDWNAWNPRAHILHDPEGDGIWEIKLRLNSNQDYRYQFLIDGTYWIPDPGSLIQVDDGFGGTNSILEI